MSRIGTTVLVCLLAAVTANGLWAAVPGTPARDAAATPADLALAVWTPLALVSFEPLPERAPGPAWLPGDLYGPTYILKAPTDGVVDYLYTWTGIFYAGQPLVRLYEPKLLEDWARARAVARKFDATPYIMAARRPSLLTPGQSPLLFPSPTTPNVRAPRELLTPPSLNHPPPLPSAPEPRSSSRAGLSRAGEAAPRAEAAPRRETPPPPSNAPRAEDLRQKLAAAEQRLASVERELAARKQLQEAGVLAEDEVARFRAQREQAAADVEAARKALKSAGPAERTTPEHADLMPPPPGGGSAPGLDPEEPSYRGPAASFPVAVGRPSVPSLPGVSAEIKRLSMPRWQDLFAPTGGMVVKPLQSPGAQVKKGDPLLRVANSAWARMRARVSAQLAHRFEPSSPVQIGFPELPGMVFTGWVTRKTVRPGDDRVEIELQVTYPADRYRTHELLTRMAYGRVPALAAQESELLPSGRRLPRALTPSERLLGLLPEKLAAGERGVQASMDRRLAGRLALIPAIPYFGPAPCKEAKLKQRLDLLHEWQSSFVEGMTTALFDQRLVLSYPAKGEVGGAVERMLQGGVSHDPGYCARTLRQALGWGLGDAYQWALSLPQKGYKAREDGLPRPGDILVWPFTYGANHSQHIGVCVEQNGELMLLSNLEGNLGTSEIVGGYLSFYKPEPAAAAASSAARR